MFLCYIILSTSEQIAFIWNQVVHSNIKKHEVVRDHQKFGNHCCSATTRTKTPLVISITSRHLFQSKIPFFLQQVPQYASTIYREGDFAERSGKPAH